MRRGAKQHVRSSVATLSSDGLLRVHPHRYLSTASLLGKVAPVLFFAKRTGWLGSNGEILTDLPRFASIVLFAHLCAGAVAVLFKLRRGRLSPVVDWLGLRSDSLIALRRSQGPHRAPVARAVRSRRPGGVVARDARRGAALHHGAPRPAFRTAPRVSPAPARA